MKTLEDIKKQEAKADTNCYRPEPEDIAAACQQIQADWSEQTRRNRDWSAQDELVLDREHEVCFGQSVEDI
jgi:hypothetical protein